jgi:hypothetical protein
MQYMLLIYTSENEEPAPGTKELDDLLARHFAFSDETQNNGQYQHSAPLQPVATATSVRVRDGKMVATDGPFAETKEQLGGYYLLDCKDLDEAIELAAKLPEAEYGCIEVRPIRDLGQEG